MNIGRSLETIGIIGLSMVRFLAWTWCACAAGVMLRGYMQGDTLATGAGAIMLIAFALVVGLVARLPADGT